ncbi:MerR family transcriptional regulator [Terribacillus sp. 179-K 1B1 HS]|uniref:MerR family transcriptional regulator n=1 Tax=Terribacillus sp. 179-K 1B1 HS TaxID=3142388 RepID=UPI00399F53CD
MQQTYTLKELTQSCGVSEDTVRYYEKMNLLPPVSRKSNGHRVFHEIHRETLLMIKCLKKTGMSLEELRPILLLQLNNNDVSDQEWEEKLTAYQAKIKKQQADLQVIWELIEEKRINGVKLGHFQ